MYGHAIISVVVVLVCNAAAAIISPDIVTVPSVLDLSTTITKIVEATSKEQTATTTTTTHSPVNNTVCYDTVGCFSNFPPFDNAQDVLPQSPTDIGTIFLLYTSNNPDPTQPYQLDHMNETLLVESRYDPTLPTKFIIHGFTNTIKTKWLYEMKDELLKKERCNVVIVVWGPGAWGSDSAIPDYSQAVANTRVVAKQTKMVIDMMERQGGLLKQIHMIGHSLGAHTSGHIGYLLKPENKTLGRITGLDPAEPDYLDHPKLVRLDKNDADFVDVIHTNGAPIGSGGAGMKLACGDVDFYVNGGEKQPDCSGTFSAAFGHLGDLVSGKVDEFGTAVACSHTRAHEVFTESINSLCSFTAYPCDNFETFQRGDCLSCGSEGCGVLGYYSDWYRARGPMYLNTRLSPPFCGHHYYLEMKILGNTRGLVQVQLNGTWGVSEWLYVTSTDKQGSLKAGSVISKLRVSKQEVGNIQSVNIRYTKAGWHVLHWSSGKTTLHAEYVSILAGENGKRYKLCIPKPIVHQETTHISQENNKC